MAIPFGIQRMQSYVPLLQLLWLKYHMQELHTLMASKKPSREIHAICCLALSPGPSPRGEAWYTCLPMREIFRYIFHKKLCALPCWYAEDYTNQETEFSTV